MSSSKVTQVSLSSEEKLVNFTGITDKDSLEVQERIELLIGAIKRKLAPFLVGKKIKFIEGASNFNQYLVKLAVELKLRKPGREYYFERIYGDFKKAEKFNEWQESLIELGSSILWSVFEEYLDNFIKDREEHQLLYLLEMIEKEQELTADNSKKFLMESDIKYLIFNFRVLRLIDSFVSFRLEQDERSFLRLYDVVEQVEDIEIYFPGLKELVIVVKRELLVFKAQRKLEMFQASGLLKHYNNLQKALNIAELAGADITGVKSQMYAAERGDIILGKTKREPRRDEVVLEMV